MTGSSSNKLGFPDSLQGRILLLIFYVIFPFPVNTDFRTRSIPGPFKINLPICIYTRPVALYIVALDMSDDLHICIYTRLVALYVVALHLYLLG
jgi:hypothetical protein